MNQSTNFNTDELLHLAIYASENETPEKALIHLKQLLNQDPEHALGLYLMGALHAEIGMHQLAIEEIARALELNPQLPPTAPFQLGLLLITSGQLQQAQIVWSELDKYGEEDPLYLFKSGLLELANNNFEPAIIDLRKGLEINSANEPLNRDMRKVLESAEKAIAENDDTNSDGQRMLLSIYENEH